MAGGRPSGINYVKPSEPSFLTKFKQQAGYKEGPGVETKREIPKFDEEEVDNRPETEDEKPVVVVLRDGDMSQAEADEYEKNQDEKEALSSEGKIMFKKPAKRTSEETDTSDLNTTSSKKKKTSHRDKRKGDGKDAGKKVKNASLLSFGDEEDEEGT